jgi:hypothetical protein
MKKFAIALLAVSLFATLAQAQVTRPAMGIFDSTGPGTDCDINWEAFSNGYVCRIYVLLGSGVGDIQSITGVEFKLDNWPVLEAGDYTGGVNWLNSGVVTDGGLDDANGVRVEYATELAGPDIDLVHLTINDRAAFGGDNAQRPVTVDGYQLDSAQLRVRLADFTTWAPVNGVTSYFDCNPDGSCVCLMGITPADESTWSTIKCLY